MNKIIKKVTKLAKSVKIVENLSAEQSKVKISEIKMGMIFITVESVAVSILALLLFIGAPSVFPEIINPYLPSSLKIMQAIVAVPTIFWILTILGNIFNSLRIFKLQRKLSSK